MGHSARLLILLSLLLAGQVDASELFMADSTLDISLRGPLSTLIGNKQVRQEYPFVLGIGDQDIAVSVRVRGKTRVSVCRFPPLRLRFRGDDLPQPFTRQDTVKLVTHCKGDNKPAENNVLDEYAAYRIFNLITDSSYRVRLLRINYVDTDGEVDDLDRPYYGFLIEPDEALAGRLGSAVAEITGVRYPLLDAKQTGLMYVFQYLIGNVDWSLLRAEGEEFCCHNVDLLEREGQLVAIPYDFDYSGLVDAIYAVPNRSVDIRRVTERRYRGYCLSPMEDIAAALKTVVALQDEILTVASDVPALEDRYMKKRLRFLSYFFSAAEDEEELLERFARDCVGPS